MARPLLLAPFLCLPFLAAAGASAETRSFNSPTVKGVRLDWCKHWARECGKPAADLYCREQGYQTAASFAIDHNVGSRGISTVVFGDGRICKAPTCSAFRTITCERAQPAKKPEPEAPAVTLAVPGKTLQPTEPKKPDVKLAVPGKVLTPAEERKPSFIPGVKIGPVLPGGASLVHCARSDCEFALTHDLEIKPDAASQSGDFRWDVSKVPGANGARWQVATTPFPAFAGGGAGDLEPPGLAASGEGPSRQGALFPDFKEIAGKLPKSGAAPESFYVRILPLSKPGSGKVVGQPSNVIRVYYFGTPPPQEPVKIYTPETRREPGPQYSLVRVEYTSWQTIENWPSGCKQIPRDDGRSGLEAVGYALGKTFDFASDGFDWIKGRIVDAASFVTGGIIPRKVFEVALEAALVSAGIPPDIPNFNEILSQGADQIAGEIAKQVVKQVPTGEVAAKLGEVATDLTAEQIGRMTEDEIRERLEAAIEKQSEDALRNAAAAAEAEIQRTAKDTYCRTKSIPPTYRVTVRNTGARDYRNVAISVSDSETVFKSASVTLTLGRGKTATAILMPEPEIRIVHKSQLQGHDDSNNRSHWFQAYYNAKRTQVRVSGTGDRVCEKRMAPPFDWQCHDESRSLLSSPQTVVLSEGHAWP